MYAVSPSEQFGYAHTIGSNPQDNPFIWRGSPTAWTNLVSAPTDSGVIYGISGDQQVGHLNGHASIWTGSSQSRIDLHVPSTTATIALAASEGQQTGFTLVETSPQFYHPHAALWHGSASSWVDLHPPDAFRSMATAAAADQQGGWVDRTGVGTHAVLWSGSLASMVDMNPPGAVESSIAGMAPGQQVGWTRRPGESNHAALWRGTAESWVDLAPGGRLSQLMATCGSAQVGYANIAGQITAGIWFGTAESFVPLASTLPPGYFQSIATAVAFDGQTYYVGGYARNLATNMDEAFLWSGIPAPATLTPLAGAMLLLSRRRRIRRGISP